MKKLHPQIWELLIKSYKHSHEGNEYLLNLLESLPLSTEFKGVKKYRVEDDLKEFLTSLNVDDSLLIIKDALEDDGIKKMENDNWNYYGDYVKHWRDKIIKYLEKSGINFDEKNGTFYKSGNQLDISSGFTAKVEFISSIFYDEFYNQLKKEINRSYRFKIYTSTFILSRKMIENLVIDVLRLKFPPLNEVNIDLYFRTKDGRFHDFTILLKNLEDKKHDFDVDTQIIEEFISLIKPFRPKANSKAHSIIMIGEEKELLDLKIERMVELILKLKNNLLNDLKKR